MGIKKLFKIKPPPEATPEENREYLNEMGIATKNEPLRNRQKFAAYGKFATDKLKKKVYAPEGYDQYAYASVQPSEEQQLEDLNESPYDQASMVNNRQNNARANGVYVDPYSTNTDSPYGNMKSPYANTYGGSSTTYDRSTSPYQGKPYNYGNQQDAGTSNNPYGGSGASFNAANSSSATAASSNAQQQGNPYASLNNKDPYGSSSHSSSAGLYNNAYNGQSQGSIQANPSQEKEFNFERNRHDDNELDLNETLKEEVYNTRETGYDDDDLNNSIHERQETGGVSATGAKGYQTFEDVQQQRQHEEKQEEDEEVDAVKQQIKFTKQSSVASTRNTLKMAQDAEAAGMNTLGMLGHQSEKLNNVERNLNLMQIQNRVADDKVSELKKLNRNILAVHVANPFHSKRRAREQEDRIKMQRMADKQVQEDISSTLHQSTRRIESAMSAPNSSEVRDRYQRQQVLEKAKRYQFENDEEDDEMELEIDKNLDKIGHISGRLKKLAVATGKEIDSQQDRIKRIEENTDDLDIKIHVNTTRLTNIR